jgi:sortase A
VLIATGLLILIGGPGERSAPEPDAAGQRAQAEAVHEIQQHLDDPVRPVAARTSDRGPARHRLAPGVRALVTIPRLDLSVPMRAGTDAEALAGGLGHWHNGIRPGQRGNFVLAGHRVTETEPFADFPALRPGDRVVVQTSNAVYTAR